MNIVHRQNSESARSTPARSARGTAANAGFEHILRAMYPLAVLLVIVPIIEVIAQVWPIRAGSISWRFGSVGLAIDNALVPLAGWALLLTIAVRLGHARTAKVLAIVSFAAGLALLTAGGIFTLDALQVRAGVAEGAPRRGFQLVAGKALLTALLYAPTTVGLGIAAWRATRSAGTRRVNEQDAGVDILLNSTTEAAG